MKRRSDNHVGESDAAYCPSVWHRQMNQCENGPEEIHEVVVGDKCRQNL